MALPTYLTNLDARKTDVDNVIHLFRYNQDSLRDEICEKFNELVQFCYEDYLYGTVHRVIWYKEIPYRADEEAMVPENAWIPLFNEIKDLMEKCEDSNELISVLEEWKNAYQTYCEWVVGNVVEETDSSASESDEDY